MSCTLANITDNGTYLLHQISDAEINTSGAYARVKVYAEVKVKNVTSKVLLLNERYYAHNNKVVVYDLHSIIRDILETYAICIANISISVTEAASTSATNFSFSVLYCNVDRGWSVDDVLSKRFLCSLQYQLIFDLNVPVLVAHYSASSTDIKAVITCVTSSNHLVNKNKFLSTTDVDGNNIYSVKFTVAELLTYCKSIDSSVVDIAIVSLICGNKYMNLYVHSNHEGYSNMQTFIFYNEFNLPEFFSFPGITTQKAKADKDIAMVGRKRIAYNHTPSVSYSFSSATFNSYIEDCMEVIVNSHRIKALINNAMRDIIITDSTCEIHNDNASMQSIKLDYELSDDVPVLRTDSDKSNSYSVPEAILPPATTENGNESGSAEEINPGGGEIIPGGGAIEEGGESVPDPGEDSGSEDETEDSGGNSGSTDSGTSDETTDPEEQSARIFDDTFNNIYG